MNNTCFPIGLSINDRNIVNMLCIKNSFDYHIEKRVLNKIYCNEKKSLSLKNMKKKQKKTKKSYT